LGVCYFEAFGNGEKFRTSEQSNGRAINFRLFGDIQQHPICSFFERQWFQASQELDLPGCDVGDGSEGALVVNPTRDARLHLFVEFRKNLSARKIDLIPSAS
jgi:hypothetical protein